MPVESDVIQYLHRDLGEELKRGQIGGVGLNKKRIWSISYADDMIILAETERELKDMMKRMRKYLERKRLILSEEKSEVMVFEKGRGRMKKRKWLWEDKEIEEVKEVKYLGYILQKNGRSEGQLREGYRKAVIAMKSTWSIGERIFKKDYKRRMKMFRALVNSVAFYGAEICG